MKHTEDLDPYLFLLRRRLRGRNRYASGLPDPVAIANVALLVVLFLVYAGPLVVRVPGVRVTLPEVANPDALPYGSLVLTVTRDSLIFFNDERTNLHELPGQLARAAFHQTGSSLIVEADDFVQTATLMRIMDICRSAGIRNVSVAGRLPASPSPAVP
jgi:biopolymer transport protein ExbD